jgi:ubiquinol-cytochrome c reductase cytochrome c1 subunit
VNNAYFKDVAMPNVFWDLQGQQKPVYTDKDGAQVLERLENLGGGKMSPEEFDQAMLDLVNFMVYAAEPAQYDRLRIGKYVIFFLLILAVILFKLKKEYWKDIE